MSIKFTKEEKKDIIINEVVKYYNTDFETITKKSRKRELVIVRQICMYMLKKCTKMSLQEIGDAIGMKDHATVLYSIKTINNLIDTDRLFIEKIAVLVFIIENTLKNISNKETITKKDLQTQLDCFTNESVYLVFGSIYKIPKIEYAYIDEKGSINLNKENESWKKCLIIH